MSSVSPGSEPRGDSFVVVIIIMPHRSTTYVDVAYCYRSSSVVCRSVCRFVTLVSTAKNGLDAVWVLDSGAPKECVRWRSRSPHRYGQFLGKGASIVKYRLFALSCAKKQLAV